MDGVDRLVMDGCVIGEGGELRAGRRRAGRACACGRVCPSSSTHSSSSSSRHRHPQLGAVGNERVGDLSWERRRRGGSEETEEGEDIKKGGGREAAAAVGDPGCWGGSSGLQVKNASLQTSCSMWSPTDSRNGSSTEN